MIVDVHCEDDTIQIAQIKYEEEDVYVVSFLEKSGNFYNFSPEFERVPKESIAGFYDVENLEDTDLYMKVRGGYELIDDSEDEDFVYSESDESESESVVDDDDEDDEA